VLSNIIYCWNKMVFFTNMDENIFHTLLAKEFHLRTGIERRARKRKFWNIVLELTMADLSFLEICSTWNANLSFEQRNLKVSYSSLDILSMSQAKVQQLYKLDRLLQEESGTLHSLQQDKVGISIIMITQTKTSILKKCNWCDLPLNWWIVGNLLNFWEKFCNIFEDKVFYQTWL